MRQIHSVALWSLALSMLSCRQLREPETKGNADTPRPIEAIERACLANSGPDCRDLAGRYMHGDGVVSSLSEAARFYELGCAADDSSSCHAIGQAYMLGAGVRKDLDKAQSFLAKACSSGDGHGCFKLGGILAGGASGPPKDPTTGLQAFLRACDLGISQGCYRAGSVLEFGLPGVTADLIGAKDAYAAGCGYEQGRPMPERLASFGEASACFRLGVILRSEGSGKAEKDVVNGLMTVSREYLARQCNQNAPLECHFLGMIYASGDGVEVDVVRAKEYFERACEAENPLACAEAERLRGEK